jgi:hypothetical protein
MNVVVGLDTKIGDLCLYLPSGCQVDWEFAENNKLLRKPEGGGYLNAKKRNICAIRLRGVKSDGILLPISCLDKIGGSYGAKEGDCFDVWNGHAICRKYIPRSNCSRNTVSSGKVKSKEKINIAPLFAEHVDTAQLSYNLDQFRAGDEIEISLKMHGTSQRTGYLPVFKGYKRSFWDIVMRRKGEPVYDYSYVTGTRRTVLENYEGGYYGSNSFREPHSKFFEGKLWKGETVYYEVVGFTDSGMPIMPNGDNKKVGKDFVKQYGETTTFSYGCEGTESDVYVYRMTMTNEDGNVVEYSPDFMRYRCEQIGVKTVPVWDRFTIPEFTCISGEEDEYGIFTSAGDYVLKEAEHFYDGTDPVGKTHVREGVVVRILNRPTFTAFKHKNHSFKMLSGIALENLSVEKIENISKDLLEEM